MGSTEENGGGGEMTLNCFLRLGSNWQPFQYVLLDLPTVTLCFITVHSTGVSQPLTKTFEIRLETLPSTQEALDSSSALLNARNQWHTTVLSAYQCP